MTLLRSKIQYIEPSLSIRNVDTTELRIVISVLIGKI